MKLAQAPTQLIFDVRLKILTHHLSFVLAQVATVRPSFTLFEARSINFAIVVYSECVQVDGRLV